MIKINLAGKVKKKSKAPLVMLIILLVAAVAGAGYHFGPVYLPIVVSAAQNVMQDVMPAPPPAPAERNMPLPPPVPRSAEPEVLPSSGVRSRMAENVVRDVIEPDAATMSKLDVPYAEMSVPERINYEALYGRNVFDMIARSIPPGIRLRTLDIADFESVHASGSGVSQPILREMFASFRGERGELLPQPHSQIRDNARGGYTFDIRHRTNFGLGISDGFQAIDHIGFAGSVPAHVRTFTQLAAEHNVVLTGAPARQSAQRLAAQSGETVRYRRITYRAVATTTFGDFHAFVRALYDAQIPVALVRVSMAAVRDDVIRATVDIGFTVRE